MYNYDFKSENILCEKHNVFAVIKEKELFVNIIVTNKNLLIFYNLDNDFVMQKTKGVFISANYELLVKYNLNNIKYYCENANTIIDNDVILYEFLLNEMK